MSTEYFKRQQEGGGDDDFDPEGSYNRDANPYLVGPGIHPFVVTNIELGVSSAGNRMVIVDFEVCDRRDPSFGRWSVRDWFVLSNTASKANLSDLVRAVRPGLKKASRDNPQGLDPSSEESWSHHILGGHVVATVVHEDGGMREGRDGIMRKSVRTRIGHYTQPTPAQRKAMLDLPPEALAEPDVPPWAAPERGTPVESAPWGGQGGKPAGSGSTATSAPWDPSGAGYHDDEVPF